MIALFLVAGVVAKTASTGTDAFQDGAFQGGAWQGTVARARGDDAGGVAHSTGQAVQSIYERQIREIEERFPEQPVPKTARKRKAKIRALETAVEQFAQQPLPAAYSLQPLLQSIEDFDGTKSHYTAIMLALEAYLEQARVAQARRERHKRIAIAMLLAA